MLARRKVPKPLCILLSLPWRMAGWDLPAVLPLEPYPFPSGSQSHSRSGGSPRSSWSSAPKSKHLSWGRMDFPKPCPWVFQCPNFMLVVMTYKIAGFVLKTKEKITLRYFKRLQIFQIWPKAVKMPYFPNHKPHSLLKSNRHLSVGWRVRTPSLEHHTFYLSLGDCEILFSPSLLCLCFTN